MCGTVRQTYFPEGPYLCAGIRTGCGDAGTARSRGRFRRTLGLGTCSLSFLLSRDLQVTTGVKRVNALPAAGNALASRSEGRRQSRAGAPWPWAFAWVLGLA